MTTITEAEFVPATATLGANKVTFVGDRTSITFYPRTPGPIISDRIGGELAYTGPEGNFTLFGAQIQRAETPLGFLLTLVVRPDDDTGEIEVTVVLPSIVGVTMEAPVEFATIAVKTTGRGHIDQPGPALTYDVLPLTATAENVLLAE